MLHHRPRRRSVARAAPARAHPLTAGLLFILLALAAVFVPSAGGQQASVRAVRISAEDPAALAGFYTLAFGFNETRRITGDTFLEIIMNAGGAPQTSAAAAAGGATLVIITRPARFQPQNLANVILDVKSVAGSIEAAERAGGTLHRPAKTTRTGATYAFILDPAGNQIELLGGP